MIRKNLFFVCLVFLTTYCLQSSAQVLEYNGIAPHPRILLKKGEESIIIKDLKQNSELSKIHAHIIGYCNSILDEQPSKRVMEGKRLLAISRTVLKRVFYLSYAFRITGDIKYSKRAEKEMLAAAAFPDWNPSHFLDVGEMVMGLAIGYDWLYDNLQPSTKRIVRKAIVEKGFIPSQNPRYAWFLNVDHNWNQVCNAGLLYGALAIYEDETTLSKSIIDRSLKTITQPLNSYGPDGNYAEGYGYWGYGTSFQVLYLAALESAFGSDLNLSQIPGFLQTARFMEFMTGPTNLPFNFSDAEKGSQGNVIMYWFAKKTQDPSLLWVEKEHLKSTKPNFAEDRILPALMVFASGINLHAVPPPPSHFWSGKGKNPVILVRTDWKDPNALYLGFKGGKASLSHGHMDAGSFVFDAMGVRWAMDLGMQQYYSLEKEDLDLWNMSQNSQRWEVFRYNNKVHNTLTINNKLHNVSGEAHLIETFNTPEKKGGGFDLTEIFKSELKKAEREVSILNDTFLQVTDKIEAGEKPALVQWTMATPTNVTILNKNTFELQKDGKKLHVIIDAPNEFQLQTWTTQSKNSYDAPNPGTRLIGFTTELAPHQERILKVRLVPISH